jgi:enoyl-CoA hydratase/carnithine racemase
MSSPYVQVEEAGPVRVVRLARADKKNALTGAMYDALTEALERADRDEAARAIVLLGAPGIFSAGNDLGDFLSVPPAGESSPVFRFLKTLTSLGLPLVAGVDGPAVGIGTTLLLHCDLVVASTRARFVLPFVNLGLVPEAASSLLLPLVAGPQRAAEWLLLGEPFGAEAAAQAGLVNRVVDPEAIEATTLGLGEALARRPREAVRLSKALLRAGQRDAVQAAMSREGDLFIERLRAPETIAAMSAFLSRRGG